MSELDFFTFGEWSFRYLMRDGQPWFVVVDLCAALGLGNATKALLGTPDKDRGQTPLNTAEGGYEQVNMTNIVNEPGLWRLIFKSRRPEAERLKTFVFEEVLPALREHGYYAVPQVEDHLPVPTTLDGWDQIPASLLLAMAKLKDERDQDKAIIAEMEQPARAYQVFLSADGLISVADAAKSLRRDLNIETGFGQNRLFLKLAEMGWVYRDRTDGAWRAAQKQMDLKRLAQRENYYTTTRGERRRTAPTVLFTQKGRHDLWVRLRNPLGVVAAIEEGDIGDLGLPERLG